MKISISFLPEEEEALATGVLSVLRGLFKNCRLRESNNHPPYRQYYLTIRSGRSSCQKDAAKARESSGNK